MRIPEAIIDDIRNAADIVDIIGAHVRLKKRGKNFLGLCPFHQEKTPSFTVSAEKQMYHCFGCGAGGNVFTFLMEHGKLSFVEAVRFLADRVGILLPAEGSDDSPEAAEQERLLAATRFAGLRFYDHLMNSVEGTLAREYFHHRGFTDATIRTFGLGYALHSWDDLLTSGGREGFNAHILEKAGLVVRRDDGSGFYDRFRGRAMFPVFSASGRTIAFGARKVREDDPLAKYINSPETPIYNKSRVLYGLSQAKDALRERERALLVEGYVDLITLFQAGFHNVVASSGTALTEEQIQLLKRYVRQVTLVYDADSAGSKATVRGGDLLLEQDIDVQVAELPANEDPDSFVRKNGPEAFQTVLDGAVSFLTFRARQMHTEGLFATPEGKARAIRSLVGTVARVQDELKRTFLIKQLAKEYDVYEHVLLRELDAVQARKDPPRAQAGDRFPRQATHTVQPSTPSAAAPPSAMPPAERDLLRLMLEHGSAMVKYVLDRMDRSGFSSPAVRSVLEIILRFEQDEEFWDAGMVLDALPEGPLRRMVAELAVSKHEISKGWEEMGSGPTAADPRDMAVDCIVRLQVEGLDVRVKEAYAQLRDAELRGEDVSAYQQTILDLQREKRDLLARKGL